MEYSLCKQPDFVGNYHFFAIINMLSGYSHLFMLIALEVELPGQQGFDVTYCRITFQIGFVNFYFRKIFVCSFPNIFDYSGFYSTYSPDTGLNMF